MTTVCTAYAELVVADALRVTDAADVERVEAAEAHRAGCDDCVAFLPAAFTCQNVQTLFAL